MLDNITFRDAQLSDLQEIVDIYNSTISSRMVTADLEPVTVDNRKPWFEEHSPDLRPLWVFEMKGKICGWLSFQSFYGRPAYNGTAEISIYIHENYRGKKLGQYIVQEAMKACPRLKIKTLLCFIFGHNEPSLRLFNKFGFEEWANLPKVAELDGIERDLIILGKRILHS
ncbi:GNAT family N-acetyltransferase [Terrilactibacillus laevilacticus]|uniref:GNAT family N-acetyltransferase n=1 Tax=Terrilactibacillus laevilacticus TaxID=1380157 RepID=A0ABW5PM09_9BACI|nr:GNAT family N-acetyltransferase [Terrilactibacillus laevilacticus]